MATPLPEPLERVYDIVARSPNLAADSAFVAALPHLSEPLREAAIERLVERGQVKGLSSLVAGFGGYDGHLRGLILEKIDGLFEATRACMASDSVDTRLGAIDLIRSSSQCRLAYLLSEVLTRRCPKTSSAAAAALVSIAQAVLERRAKLPDCPDVGRLRQDAEQLSEALGRALDSWAAHFRTEVLMASMWLCDLTEAVLFKKASEARSNLPHALNEVLRGNCGPLMAGYALRALCHPELRGAAAQEIAGNTDASFVDGLLDEAWITLDPENAKSCSWIREPVWVGKDSGRWQSLRGQRACNAVRLVALSAMGQDEKLSVYRRMISTGSAELQEAALWRVTEMYGAAVTQLLRRVAGWQAEMLSQIASIELFRRNPKPHTIGAARPWPGRTGGDQRATTADFETYWDRYDILDRELRESEGRRLRSELPTFASLIRQKLTDGDAEDRLQGLRIVRMLDMAADFEERIYALGHDPQEKTRSLAISLLSQLEGATAVRILRQAINDPDERVQANAVEVLAALEAWDETERLAPKLEAADNRVRANTIKALIGRQVREAAVALIGMLDHKSAAHRISALWVVQRLGLTTLEPRIQQIAENDPDQHVRDRARKVLRDSALLAAAAANGRQGEVES